LQCNSDKQERTYKTKHGTIATMNTTNIGSGKVEQPIGSRVTVRGDSYFEGQSGTITQISNSRQASVQFDSGERDLINLRYLVWEGTESAGEIIEPSSQISESDMTQSSTFVPKKIEVNTDDILIAFISNLDCMSEAQVVAAVKAIAHLNPDLIRQVLESSAL
jgi:hypothetical protein